MKDMIAKDYSGIVVAKKKNQCYDCKKDILPGENYLKQKIMNKVKTICLGCRQKRLDIL